LSADALRSNGSAKGSSKGSSRIRLALRLTRVGLHLGLGLATCALVFPWIAAARRDWLIRRWSGQLLGMCGVRVEQAPGVAPLAHAMVVANHVSWLDIFVINACVPCRFVAKSEIRAWPVLGKLAEQAGTVFIERGQRRELRQFFKGLVACLEQGQRVAFFPEGTTAQQGALLPFHANLFEAALDAKVAVQPYALRYLDAHGALHPSISYTGETTFVQSMLAVLSGAPVRACLSCLEPLQAHGAQRRDLAQAAHREIARALGHSAAPQ
jgi:1-acyl-sn-glycerol-3-phosphate acyltransferase